MDALFDRLLNALAWIAAAILAAATLAVGLDVLVRVTRLGSWPWVTEATEYGMMIATFLGAPWVLRESAHVKIDFVLERMNPRLRRFADWAANLIGLVICAVVLGFGTLALLRSFRAGSKIFQQFTIPEWWTLAFLPLCFVLLTIELIRRLARMARGGSADLQRAEHTL